MQAEFSYDQQTDEQEDLLYFEERLQDIRDFLGRNRASLDGYLETCEQQGLLPDYTAFGAAEAIRKQIENHIIQFEKILAQPSRNIQHYTRKISTLNQLYRVMTQLKVPASRMLAWCSTAYNQSLEAHFFHPESTGGAGERFNYDRTSTQAAKPLETQFGNVLGFDPESISVVTTSSGMASYTLLENYFINDVLKPGDQIYIPRLLYGETELIMFRNTDFFNIVRHNHNDEQAIIEDITRLNPRIVFLESMQNNVGTRLLDVMSILKFLSEMEREEPLHIVIDDALLTGAINPFVYSSDKLKIYYVVSAIKYLQLGMDTGFAGLVAVVQEDYDRLRRLRGFTGLNLYDHMAWLYPSLTRDQFVRRMKRLTRNAYLVSQMINDSALLGREIYASYPLFDQKEKATKLSFIGALLTLKGKNTIRECNIQNLKPFYKFVDAVLLDLKEKGISAVNSESFGFSTPRVYVGWCKNEPPYIRIACGDRSYEETKLFAEALVEVLDSNLHLIKREIQSCVV